jgi:hypothetical protein
VFGKKKEEKSRTFVIVCVGHDHSQAAKRKEASFESLDEPIAIMTAAATAAVSLISQTGIREGYYIITNDKKKEIGRGNISGGNLQTIKLGRT